MRKTDGERHVLPIGPIKEWLPEGRTAAVCFSIDDIHPARSIDCYDAGGDLGDGALGRVEWLLNRHPKLRTTLFVTADWREISPQPTRKILSSIPWIRDRVYLARPWPKGTMQLDRHPQFIEYLVNLPRTEIGLHGLYHCHKGLRIPVEFQDEGYADILDSLTRMIDIFDAAGLPFVPGLCPPGWNAPPSLLDAMVDKDINFVGSARDIFTPISETAVTNMSGMNGVSLIFPEVIHGGRILHIPANFHSTSPVDRATDIAAIGGLISIKAHIVKNAMGYTSYDGLDEIYTNYLDLLLFRLEDAYGDELWWTSMTEICQKIMNPQTNQAK
jgi:hypothetical protein